MTRNLIDHKLECAMRTYIINDGQKYGGFMLI